jgi:hypothetical protein
VIPPNRKALLQCSNAYYGYSCQATQLPVSLRQPGEKIDGSARAQFSKA